MIQLCDLDNETLDLIIREKRVYSGLPPSRSHKSITMITIQLILTMMKLYYQLDLSNDLSDSFSYQRSFLCVF